MAIRRVAAALVIGAAVVLSGCGGGSSAGAAPPSNNWAGVAAESNTIRIGTPTIHLPRRTNR